VSRINPQNFTQEWARFFVVQAVRLLITRASCPLPAQFVLLLILTNRIEKKMFTLLAYFDPSSGSLLMQALVGGFSGLVVFGRYLWSQFRTRNTRSLIAATSSSEIPVQK